MPATATINSEELLVREAEKDWNEAILRQDSAAALRHLAQDYVLVGIRSTGANMADRDAWLNTLTAMRIHSYHADVVRVRVHGDSAVVSMKGDWHLELHGREINENFLVTDVWSRTEDGWRVVLRHSSPYPK